MNDEDLEVLITIDDPSYGPDEDTFHHLEALTHPPDHPFPIIGRHWYGTGDAFYNSNDE